MKKKKQKKVLGLIVFLERSSKSVSDWHFFTQFLPSMALVLDKMSISLCEMYK